MNINVDFKATEMISVRFEVHKKMTMYYIKCLYSGHKHHVCSGLLCEPDSVVFHNPWNDQCRTGGDSDCPGNLTR